MKTFYSLLILIFLGSVHQAAAQGFTQGSLELTQQDTTCEYVPNQVINEEMIGVAAFGPYEHIFLYDTGCGTPQHGTYFLGLSSDSTFGDAISLRLSNPLTIGQPYTITYYEKRPMNITPARLEFGYSNDSTSFGNSITVMPIPVNFNWEPRTVTFSPTSTTNYITVRVYPTPSIQDSGMLHVDNFSIFFASEVPENSLENNVQISPNPAQDNVMVTLNSTGNETTNIRITDMSGKTLFNQYYTTQRADIDVSSLPAGVYMLQASNEANRMTEKLVITR